MKENKIIKYGLEAEVDTMLDQDMSLADVASAIKLNHPDIEDLKDISSMSIMRYRNSRDQLNISEKIEEGKDPVSEFITEYRNAIKSLLDKSDTLYKESLELLEQAKQSESMPDKLKAVKEVRDNIEQERKAWVSLAQYGVRQTSNIFNINVKKEQNIKVMLLNWSKDLCPACRSKVSKYLTLDAEEEKEEYAEN